MEMPVNYEDRCRKAPIFVGIVHYGNNQLLLDTLNHLDSDVLNIWVINHNQEPLDCLDNKIDQLWDLSNPGYASGMNKLLYQAQLEKADYAIFLTNDVELRMHTLNLWIGMLIKSCQTVEQPILRKKKWADCSGNSIFS